MKNIKFLAKFIVILNFILIPPVFAEQNSDTLIITSQTLPTLILKNNNSIVGAMNQVQIAKEKVSLARANLLPSLNLGSLISSSVNFAVTSVAFLLPFLIPNNWYNLAESKYLLYAEEDSYYALQLNTIASGLAVYYTIVNDKELIKNYEQQIQNASEIYEYNKKAYEVGLASETDVLQSLSLLQSQQILYSQAKEMFIREVSALRQLLNLPLVAQFEIGDEHAEQINEEFESPEALLPLALNVAPEKSQLKNLLAAAKEAKWSQTFNFLSSLTLGATNPSGGSVDFGNLSTIGNFNFGFNRFPTYKIGSLNMKQIQIQDKSLELQQAEILESTIKSLKEVNYQMDLALQVEDNNKRVLDEEKNKYRQGSTDMLHVLSASNNLFSAVSNRLKVSIELDNLRVTLARTLVAQNFGLIKKCDLKKSTRVGSSSSSIISKIIGGNKNTNTNLDIDKVCAVK